MREKNREDTLRLTYKLLRKLESQVNQAGFAGCPECGAPDKGSEHLPEIQHQPDCLMAAALERWEGHFSEAERGLRVAVAALGYEGEKVLVEEEKDTFRLTIPEGHVASWSARRDPLVMHESTGIINWPATHEYRKLVLEPSQPPGATISTNPGVGMGEGEKVAQDGAEEERGASWDGETDDTRAVQDAIDRTDGCRASKEVDEAVGRIVNEAIQRAVGRLVSPPGYLELSRELLRRAQEALEGDDSPEAESYRNYRDAKEATPPSPDGAYEGR